VINLKVFLRKFMWTCKFFPTGLLAFLPRSSLAVSANLLLAVS